MKRPGNADTDNTPSGSKKRRCISTSEDEDPYKSMKLVGLGEAAPPLHKIYNIACRKEKPAELFRKDLISAMKMPDNEQLSESEFWDVSDSWKQEWERGVQVPVNSKNVPNPVVRVLRSRRKSANFKLPKKMIRTAQDSFFSNEHHVFVDTAAQAESICKYDLDDLDLQFLRLFNERRDECGLPSVDESTVELLLEDFETQCSNRFQAVLKTEKGLGIEYDEDVICDVCRSPDCEDGNEMVFCDSCNMCVHQACYGIMAIPEGSWICRPCALNVKPSCILCPNAGGAMKSTSSNGENWAHVSCALWIPEVSIGCPEKMEPIMKISNIPASRWSLICTLCRERVGACIQCSVKQCKTAYHVTCAFENGLEMEMKSTRVNTHEEGVKMQSYCSKHGRSEIKIKERSPEKRKSSRRSKKKKIGKNKDIDNAAADVDEHNARLQKIRSLEAKFFKYVSVSETAELHNVDSDVVDFVYSYWVLKRKSNFNKPLLIAKCDEANLILKQQENFLYSRLKMFIHLRQDLERVRNLCYMIGKREKLSRMYFRARGDVVFKQIELVDSLPKMSEKEVEEIVSNRHGDNIYDHYVTSPEIKTIENTIGKIADDKANPYAKCYVNGVYTRSRGRTSSLGNTDDQENDTVEPHDSKPEDNIVLEKTKAKNNLQITHSPVVIKVEMKKEPQPETSVEYETNHSAKDEPLDSITTEPPNSTPAEDGDTSIETSMCDKENINSHPISPRSRKSKAHSELKHKQLKNVIIDIAVQKSEILSDDNSMCISDESDRQEVKKIKKRKRYRIRTRNLCTKLEDESTLSSETDSIEANGQLEKTPPETIEGFNFTSQEPVEDEKPVEQPVRRKRGRPRKYPLPVPVENAPVIQDEVSSSFDSEKNSLCDAVALSDDGGLKMCLRYKFRDQSKPVEPPKYHRRTAALKSEAAMHSMLRECDESKPAMKSPTWESDSASSPVPSGDQPASPRLVIRLRKDPNPESWKNDSSSSSDVPASFRIVRNDWETDGDNSNSQFPSIVKNELSDGENRHRYMMRDRCTPQRSLKCTFGRS